MYEFKCTQEDETVITYSTHSVYIPDLMEDIKNFLMACGYSEKIIGRGFGSIGEDLDSEEDGQPTE